MLVIKSGKILKSDIIEARLNKEDSAEGCHMHFRYSFGVIHVDLLVSSECGRNIN
jgi:hypothetical protein